MLCAIVNNNLVEQVREVTQEEFNMGIGNQHQAVITIDDLIPLPDVGWIFNGSVLVSPTNSTRISKLALRHRFTFNEQVTIKSASKVADTTGAMLSVLLDDLAVATYIDLSLYELQAGIGLLVQLGFLTSERANIIITTPATHDELYKGIE